MRTILRKLKKKFLLNKFFFRISSFQEEGDMICRLFFQNRKQYKGFYIDIGAQHPYRFSNTLPFYQRGWRGINVEPTFGAVNLFNTFRQRDINLHAGVSSEEGTLPFYCFKDPALNSFSGDRSAHYAASGRYVLKKIITVKTIPLAQILDDYLPEGTAIDLLSIDTEEFDLEVLQSNNWNKYIPLFIMIEVGITLEHLLASEIYNYLLARNYELIGQTKHTIFFKLKIMT